MENYDTLTEALLALRRQGYSEDFNLRPACLYCASLDLTLLPESFQVDALFRFEGETDPGDESILYAITATRHNLRGVLVNAYGMNADLVTAAMEAKLRMPDGKEREKENI
jgi:hypothetical protein